MYDDITDFSWGFDLLFDDDVGKNYWRGTRINEWMNERLYKDK